MFEYGKPLNGACDIFKLSHQWGSPQIVTSNRNFPFEISTATVSYSDNLHPSSCAAVVSACATGANSDGASGSGRAVVVAGVD